MGMDRLTFNFQIGWILFIFAISGSRVQSGDLDDWLTGDGKREWTIEAWVSILGSESGCDRGRLWSFLDDGQMIDKKCENGKEVITKGKWSVIADTADRVEINQKIFVVKQFTKEEEPKPGFPPSTVRITILREVRESQTKEVTEIRLSHRKL